jgi:carboxypeptidase family protein/TonB-dependent receptor-like protein
MAPKSGWLKYLLLACVISTCFGVSRLHAQVLYGSIVGTVTDQTGALVPGAHVTATSPLTGLKREADANTAGQYSIPNLPEGTYNLTVSAKGFKEFHQTNIELKVGSVVGANVQLEVGAMTQEVTVQASAAVLQTEKSDVSTQLGTVPVENLPTGFYRNFQYLMLLVPGAADNLSYTGALADTPERAIAIPMNGMDPASNSTRIDGAQSIFLWKPGGAALYVPPVESIQEVKISTNSYDPEKGMAGSAAVDVITKSGTNDMHGTLFWYHNNQHLNSCEPFDQNCKWRVFDPTHPRSKPKDLLNDMGGNIGGPIKKNKLFYFANWDGVFQRFTPDGRYTVPTAAMHNGDFSALLRDKISSCLATDANGNCTKTGPPIMVPTSNGQGVIGPMVQLQYGMVFDPNTGNPDGTGRAVYAAGTTPTSVGQLNVMPTSIFDPTAQAILGYWPMPNSQGITDSQGNVTRNYFMNAPTRFNRNNLDFRVDWNRTEKHFIWAKYSRMMTLTASTCGYNATIGGPCPADQSGSTNVLVQTATLGHSWSFSPTFLVDGSLGFSRMSQKAFPSDFGKNIGLDVLHIPGTNDPNDIRYSGTPTIGVSGFDSLGSPVGWEPLYRNDWTVTITQNASWTHSKHTLRFGIDIVHNHLNHWQPEQGLGPRGGIKFTSGNITFLDLKTLTNEPVNTGADNNFAEFLLGKYDEAGRSVQFQKANGKDTWWGFHFLDRWKISPKLTANLGVRYEYYPLMTRDSLGKGLEQYDPATNTVLLGGLGGNPRSLGTTTQKNLFGPRVGIAYELNDKTVIRAGFGSTFDTYPILRETRGAYPADISTDATYDGSNPAFDTAAGCATGQNNLCAWQGLGTFAGGIPPVPLPNVSTGKIPAPTDVDLRFIGPGQLKRGRVETWNITGERRLPGDFLLGVGYVGNHLTNGWGILDRNASDIDQQGPLSAAWGRTAATYQLQGFLNSHYNALQVTLDRHYYKGFYIKGAYTYSKAINFSYDTDAWGGTYWQPPLFAGPGYLNHNRGMADIDRRHIFRLGYVWELPVGAGRRYVNNNRIGRAVLGGWQLNGVWSTASGAPTTVLAAPNMYQAGNHQTLDQAAPLKKVGCLGQDPGCYWYDPSSFAIVPNTCLNANCINPDGTLETPRQHRFGSTGRNIAIYGPKHSNLDASLFRHFKLSERFDLQFRAEGLNVLNHPQWNWSTDEWGASNYCWGGGPASNPCGGTFMQTSDDNGFPAGGHRIIRFGLRLAF